MKIVNESDKGNCQISRFDGNNNKNGSGAILMNAEKNVIILLFFVIFVSVVFFPGKR